jgi:site-specific DNA-methyltransferase (adenine-specific)
MRALPAESVHAVVCDPPYGLEFMGKEWDRFRVDDPGTARHRGEYAGSHGELISGEGGEDVHPARGNVGVAYGGGKRPTTHRCVTCGKRDQFRNPHEPCGEGEWRKELIDPHAAPPTSLAFQEWCRTWALEAKRVLKPGGHLLAFGGARTYHRLAAGIEDAGFDVRGQVLWLYGEGFPKSMNVGDAVDALVAELGRGWLAAPYGSVSAEASVEGLEVRMRQVAGQLAGEDWTGFGTALKPSHEPVVLARKPLTGPVVEAVLEHRTGALNIDACRIETDGRPARVVDPRPEANGAVYAGRQQPGTGFDGGSRAVGETTEGRWPADVVLAEASAGELEQQSSSASPYFFYCGKASTAEREAGLDGIDTRHPTVKPIALMRWLCQLVTPPSGVVLDPFTGSGSTGCAAVLEDFEFVGAELEAEYIAIAEARIRWWEQHRGREAEEVLAASRRSTTAAREHADAGQLALGL